MSFTIKAPFSSVVNSLADCSEQASVAVATAVKYTMNVLSSSESVCAPSLAKKKPPLISDIIAQASEHGSAILDLGLGEGVVFIEIERNERGQRIFKATNGMLAHAVLVESTRPHRKAIWETKVAMAISALCGKSQSGKYIHKQMTIEYGISSTRWKGNRFSDLKKEFETEGLWQKENEKVIVRLPNDSDTMTFREPHAEKKAEIALKYLYLWGKTPVEEKASEKWDFATQVFLGFSSLGHLFTPWIGREPLVGPPERQGVPLEQLLPPGLPPERDASSGFSSLQQHLIQGATVCATSMLMHVSPRTAFVASVFILFPKTEAISIIDGTSVVINARKTNEVVGNVFARRSSPITIVTPLPSLITNPGSPVNLPINFPIYFSLPNYDNNLDMTLSPTNGTLPTNWLSLSMGDISHERTFSLGAGLYCLDIAISGSIAYVATGTSIVSVNIANPKKPFILGSYTAFSTFIRSYGNSVVFGYQGNNVLNVLDVTNPASMTLSSSKTFKTPIQSIANSGSNFYLNQVSLSPHYANMTVLDITNPSTIVQQSTISWPITSTQGVYNIDTNGKNVYISDGGIGSGAQVRVYNATSPTNATLITVLPDNVFSNIVFQESNLYALISSGVAVYDNSQISNPILKRTVYLGSNIGTANLLVQGSYLYAFCGDAGVFVLDISDPLNMGIVTTLYTTDSAQLGKMCNNILIVSDYSAGISFYNTQKRILSGTSNNPGLYLPRLKVRDDLGNSVDQVVPVQVGPVQVTPIPNQQIYVGNSTLLAIDIGTFQYPGATFTYSATLVGGLPLPDFINFNSELGLFLMAPQPNTNAQGTYRVQVTGNGGYGVISSFTFDVEVPNRSPIVVLPLGNQTFYSGDSFQVAFSRSTFSDLDQDTLSLSATLEAFNYLPAWIIFDPALFMFSGFPQGDGYYRIKVTARDKFGGVASEIFSITVPPTAPQVINPPGSQTGSVGNPLGFALNSETFNSIDKQPLTFTTDPLPSFLAFNNVTRTFSGTPNTAGTFTIVVHATDPRGLSTSTSFSLTILSAPGINPPVLAAPMLDQLVKAGIPFNFTVPASTFISPSNATLTYQATVKGSGAALPSGLVFNAITRTFSGIIPTPQILGISLRASDSFGGFSIDTFFIQVVASTPPVVLNALVDASATVGQFFSYTVPKNTFKDLSNNPFTVSVLHEGEESLPSWLEWDPAKMRLSGTPGLWDTNTYQTKVVRVNVWATSDVGSSKTTFNINVGGDSFYALLIKYGLSFSGIACAIYKINKEQAIAYVWNVFNKKQYTDEKVRTVVIGEEFNYKLKLDFVDLQPIRTYNDNHLLKSLPSGLKHQGNCISGIPTSGTAGYYTIEVIDHAGYISQKFDLIIKKNTQDPDPVRQPTYLEKAGSAVHKGLQAIKRNPREEHNFKDGSF